MGRRKGLATMGVGRGEVLGRAKGVERGLYRKVDDQVGVEVRDVMEASGMDILGAATSRL